MQSFENIECCITGELVLTPSVNINGVTYAGAAVASNSVKQPPEIVDIKLDLSEIANTKELMKRDGMYVYLNSTGKHSRSIKKKTVQFRTMNAIEKIENAPIEEIEEIMENMKGCVVFFYTRVRSNFRK